MIFRLALIICLMSWPLLARPWLALFGSENCDECAQLKTMWSEARTAAADPVIIYICIDKTENYLFLKQVEETLGIERPSTSFPILLLGDRMVAGMDGFLEAAPDLDALLARPLPQKLFEPLHALAKEAKQPVVSWDALPAAVSTIEPTAGDATTTPQLLYFLAKGCQKCSRQLRELLLLRQTLPQLQVDCYDIATPQGQIMLHRAMNQLSIPDTDENLAPMVVWPDGFITGRLARAEELQSVLASSSGQPFWRQEISKAELAQWQAAQSSFVGTITIWMIALAGLFDGLNPCAFATSVFLIGYLLYLKRRPRDIMVIGGSFCFGVFFTYVLFGLGLSFIIDFFNQFFWLKAVIYLTLGIIGLLLAGLHFRDALRYRRSGRASDMDMGLSKNTHRRIHARIRKLTISKSWLMVPAALILGTMVSSMELACTGQVYLPILAAINSAGLNLRAFSLLLLYNVFFILPLLVVSLLAATGVGAKSLSNWARDHVFATKVIMSLTFLGIAGLMFYFVAQDWPQQAEQVLDCLAAHEAPATAAR